VWAPRRGLAAPSALMRDARTQGWRGVRGALRSRIRRGCVLCQLASPHHSGSKRGRLRVCGDAATPYLKGASWESARRGCRGRDCAHACGRASSAGAAPPPNACCEGVFASLAAQSAPGTVRAAHPPASGRGRRDGHARRAAQPPVRAKQGKLLLISAGRLAVARGQARRVRSGETSRNRHHGVSGARYLGSARRRRSGSVPKRRRRRPASGVVECQLVRATTASRTSSTGSSLAKYAWAPAFKAELLGLETRIARQGAALRCLPPCIRTEPQLARQCESSRATAS
jgi:hypothetical protein